MLILYKVEIIFPQSLLHYQHSFSTFAWDALCRSRKTLWWTSQLFTRAAFQPVVVRKSLECTLQGDQKDGSRRVLNRDRREDEREQSTPLIHLPSFCEDRCAVWLYLWPNHSHLLFYSVCTYRSELIVTPLSKNSTNVIPWLSKKVLAITLPAEVCTLNV